MAELYSTAKTLMSLQPFADKALALADMQLARASGLVSGSDLKTYVATVERALVAAQKSNPKLAEPLVAQNASIQGEINQSTNMQQSFEQLFTSFVGEQNNEIRKLMQEVKKGTLTENEAQQKFVSAFIKKSDELIKKFKGYSASEKKVQETLEHLLKNLITAFPVSRSEEATKLLAKKPEQETPGLK